MEKSQNVIKSDQVQAQNLTIEDHSTKSTFRYIFEKARSLKGKYTLSLKLLTFGTYLIR